ncbi:MAG: MarR family winged helix-turn-helix transcriptional regulator [Acidimicrobiales bacterium]
MRQPTQGQPAQGRPAQPAAGDLQLVDAFIAASRALVAVAARSLAGLGEEITLPQYRALVVLASRGPQRAADLAARLDVTPSTASRMIERLVRKHLVGRTRTREDRRTLRVYLTRAGRDTVGAVTDRRRDEVARILSAMPTESRAALTAALRAFADAAGEVPEQDWALGWDEAAADAERHDPEAERIGDD